MTDMAKQMSFFALDEDMRALLSPIEQEGARALPTIVPADETPRPLPPTDYAAGRAGDSFLLLPAGLAPVEVFYSPIADNPALAQVDDFNSPVVVVDGCASEDGCLFNGRLYFDNDPSDSRHKLAKQLYQSLSKALGRWEKTPRFGIFVGPAAARQARAGRLALRHHALVLELP